MELVVLVDEQNNVIGTTDKATVHTQDTPLHRAFSLFLFNAKNELLITKRATSKKTFAGVWTNTVCGHPRLDESSESAANRRLQEELGITDAKVREVAPYRYRFSDSRGIVENEICPICIGFSDNNPNPDPSEVDDWKWISWDEFLLDIATRPELYSPWSKEEAIILQHSNLGLR
jgi:isopentenyl-diphosphate delta-isomerase type 1